MTNLRTVSVAIVLWAGCLSAIGAVTSTLLVEAIVEKAAGPLVFPVELGTALGALRFGAPRT